MKNKIKMLPAFCIALMVLFLLPSFVYAAGTISLAVSSSSVKTGDTVTITLYAANANNESVVADMSVTYDTSLLEFISSSDTDAVYGGGTVQVKGEDVSIKFKATASGDAYVKAEGAALTAAGTHITVSGAAASDASDTGAAKSGDNSLSSLSISPGSLSPAFKGSVTEYTAQVGGDVSEITVTPVTSNSKATVESISGNKDLKTGKNVITVLVKAENGTEAAYKITVTKGEGTTSGESEEGQKPSEDTPSEPEEPAENAPSGTGEDVIVIDGTNYRISDSFTDEEIPEGFSRADFEYKSVPYKGISFDHGHLGMYYMVNDAGESRFFVYDADRDKFYPYVRLSSGEHYIILMVVPNGVLPPERYEAATVEIAGETIAAYQYSGPSDKEIVKFDNPEEEAAYSAGSDFYIFYGMDDTGTPGWYQYDVKQATYQRFNAEAIAPADEGENYDMLLKSYNELDERYDKLKTSNRRVIGFLIFFAVVLLIIVINLILKVRELGMDDDPYAQEKQPAPKKRKTKTRAKTKAKPQKKTYQVIEDNEDGRDFYDDDDKEFMEEFEEEPNLLSRRPKREKQAGARKKEPAHKAPVKAMPRDEDDDDIEFLDLN